MGVLVKDQGLRWPGHIIPYTLNCMTVGEWAQARINEFNQRVGKVIFVPHNGQQWWVQFDFSETAAGCALGCLKGTPQFLNFKEKQENIWHEMAHACGLGHEQFHTHSDFRRENAQSLVAAKSKPILPDMSKPPPKKTTRFLSTSGDALDFSRAGLDKL